MRTASDYVATRTATYAIELAELLADGFNARVDEEDGCIRIDLGICPALEGNNTVMLVSNADDGLHSGAERALLAETGEEIWIAGLYRADDHEPFEIYCEATTAGDAVALAVALTHDAVPVEVEQPEPHPNALVWCPIAALGDPDAEDRYLRPQLAGNYPITSVVLLSEVAPGDTDGWRDGCDTHSRYDGPGRRETARAEHALCRHGLTRAHTAA